MKVVARPELCKCGACGVWKGNRLGNGILIEDFEVASVGLVVQWFFGVNVCVQFWEKWSVGFMLRAGTGAWRSVWSGWSWRWQASRYCEDMRSTCCLTGRVLVSWCRWFMGVVR